MEYVNINKIIGRENDRLRKGLPAEDERIFIKTPDARSVLARGIRYFVGDDAVWLPEYDSVAEWLADNKGRGLLCIGNCGRGKSLICQRVLPVVFQYYHRLVMNTITMTELNEKYNEYAWNKIISIDDVGVESVANKYGEKHSYFSEIVDLAERKQKLLVVSTNLDDKELLKLYGIRTIDRLKALTKVVIFKGESLRK